MARSSGIDNSAVDPINVEMCQDPGVFPDVSAKERSMGLAPPTRASGRTLRFGRGLRHSICSTPLPEFRDACPAGNDQKMHFLF